MPSTDDSEGRTGVDGYGSDGRGGTEMVLTNARIVTGPDPADSTVDTTPDIPAHSAVDSTVDIVVVDGVITAVRPSTDRTPSSLDDGPESMSAPAVIDVGGRLVLPSLVEPHAHLDKALLADDVANPTGDLLGAIDAILAAEAAGRLSHDEMVVRAGRAIDLLLTGGVTTVRSHVDVGAAMGANFVAAVAEVRDRYRDLIDIELVALAHSPMTGRAGAANRRAMEAAIDAGADVIGGCPHLEDEPDASIDVFVAMAADTGRSLDLHMDETLDVSVTHLDALARRVIDTGFTHRVTASHCVSLGLQPLERQRATAELLAQAGIGVVALPHTNLFLQGRDHPVATPRGLAPVGVLTDAGVVVAAGGDNVQDPFNPLGRGDQLEVAALMVLMAHESPAAALDMVTNGARTVMGRAPVLVKPGHRADLLAIRADGVRHALAMASADRMVFRAGRLVASSVSTSTVHHHRPD